MKDQLTSSNVIRSFPGWLQEIGVSDVTGWRWRNQHWLKTQNISGRIYIEQSEIDRFLQRVRNGEFAKSITVPRTGEKEKKVSAVTNSSANNQQGGNGAKGANHEAI